MGYKKQHRQVGFTLIEVIVASLILGLSIMAIITLLTTGLTIEAMDGLRRQARTVVASTMESPVYQDYFAGADIHTSSTGNLTTSLGIPIPYTLTIDITSSDTASWTNGDAAPATLPKSVPFNRVHIQISWVDAGSSQSFGLKKSLAQWK